MMVANSFDLWQKDSFFSAAEEVQESADMYGPFSVLRVLVLWVWIISVDRDAYGLCS